jgi:hypothetical protein
MLIKFDPSGLKETKWSEYVYRFLLGGVITSAAGLIAMHWGPSVAGLFLAFPAIFPASATLLEKHQRERKERKGLRGEERGVDVSALDAHGAAMGSVGLAGFAAICWLLLPRCAGALVLSCATLVWSLVAGSIWFFRKRYWRRS